MSDYNSSLPVRTENNGDVVVKVGDGTIPSQQLNIDASGRIVVKLDDGSGNLITSQVNGAQRALDIGINVAGVQIDPRSIRALTAVDVVSVVQSTSPWLSKDSANGPVIPGTVASFSELIGGQFNTVLPTLTSGQQAAVQVDSNGRLLVNIASSIGSISVTQGTTPWITSDLADGSSSGGIAGTKSSLSGGIYNSTAPTLTTGQQASLQLNASGALIVSTTLSNDTNYGLVGSNTLRTAAQIGNATGVANFGAGVTGAQTLRVEANQGASAIASNGWYVKPTDGTNSQSYTATGESKVSITQPLPVGTNNIGKVSIQDSIGSAFSATNPLFVTLSDTVGTSVDNYNTVSSVAANASSNHDYTVTAAKSFYSKQIFASASGKLKIEVQYETAAASGIFVSFWVGFNSTANPEILIPIPTNKIQVAGARIRVIRTNLDKQPDDVYSTISGTEQ